MSEKVSKAIFSNYLSVVEWMDDINQLPEEGTTVEEIAKRIELRIRLVKEEADETHEALSWLMECVCDDAVVPKAGNEAFIELLAHCVKELSDLLVVTYGTFATLGVDADDAFAMVMRNNANKQLYGHFDQDGKYVTPPEYKQSLKEDITRELQEYVRKTTWIQGASDGG